MTLSANKISFRPNVDEILVWVLRTLALVAGAIVIPIAIVLIRESWPILQNIGFLPFFTDTAWFPSKALYSLTPMLVSTLLVVGGALLLAAPAGILSALFCRFYAPPAIATLYRRLLELLVGIPGVVYGFWGLVVLVPLINRLHPPGTSLLAGILVLALMTVPTIALTAEASLAEVPPAYLLGAAALGLSRWGTIWGVVLPAARTGLFASLILGTGRALGETMVVLMVCGNIVQVPKGLFDPIRTLPANIALEMAYALGDHRSALFVSGLLLLLASLGLVLVAEAIADKEIYG